VVTLVFFLLRLSGDPIALLVPPGATAADIAQLRHAYGFDQPLWVQYFDYLWHAATGDLGTSIVYHQSALHVVLDRVPATLELSAAALALALPLAIPAGIWAAVHRGGWSDRVLLVLTLVGQSFPYFFLGILLILVFAVQLGWLPTSGSGTPLHLVLPAITLATYSIARTMRLMRGSLIEALGADYVRTAIAKGLLARVVVMRHAVLNALIPVVTAIGLDVGNLLGGAVVTETVFGWPGVGRAVVEAVSQRDYPVVQAGVIYVALIFFAINTILEALYRLLDPRLRSS
jgi:peptide/nickel transport system permease protein